MLREKRNGIFSFGSVKRVVHLVVVRHQHNRFVATVENLHSVTISGLLLRQVYGFGPVLNDVIVLLKWLHIQLYILGKILDGCFLRRLKLDTVIPSKFDKRCSNAFQKLLQLLWRLGRFGCRKTGRVENRRVICWLSVSCHPLVYAK